MKVLIRQTPMGAYVWQLMDTKTSTMVAQSRDYDTRKEAIDCAARVGAAWPDAYKNLTDQTPEGRAAQSNG